MVFFPSVSRLTEVESATSVLFGGLVDDAGLFPPEELDIKSAVTRHRRDQRHASAVLSHRFVIPASRLHELSHLLTDQDRFALSVITNLEPAWIEELTAVASTDDRFVLAGIEAPLPIDWQASAGTIRLALQRVPAAVPVFVEIPIRGDIEPALDFLARGGWSAKVRCGGVRSELFPSTGQIAATISRCVALGVSFKATAGLHHAVRYRDPATGFTHHGFLNILLGVARAIDGTGLASVIDALESTDTTALVAETKKLDTRSATRARALFLSYGSCSDPIDDLTALNLLSPSHRRPVTA